MIPNNIQNIHLLRKDLEAHKQIVLFIGAGINCSDKVNLLWEQVINHLFDHVVIRVSLEHGLEKDEFSALRQAFGLDRILNEDVVGNIVTSDLVDCMNLYNYALQEFPLIVKASVIKSILGGSYLSFIQDYIYGVCSRRLIKDTFESCYVLDATGSSKTPKRMHSLYQTARMIILCKDIKAVVTYNYDNFLTCAINILLEDREKYFTPEELEIVKTRNINVKDISGSIYEYSLKNDTLFVYHVHGYIPPPSEADELRDRSIVMSLEEYHEYSMTEMSAWQTSTQLHFLSHYTCMFLGLSLSDITTQRLLHYVRKSGNKERLYQLFASAPNNSGNKLYAKVHQTILDMKMDFHIAYGLTPIVCTDGFEELYSAVADMVSEISLINK